MESRTHEVDWNAHGSESQETAPNNVDFAPNGAVHGLGNGSNFDEAGSDDSDLESNDVSIEALQLALQQMTVPPCPPDLQTVLDATSLERLVYWKLQTLFDRFDEAPPNNVLRVVQEHVERPLFSLVLKKTKGNQSRAAHVLGCNRNTLHRKLKNLAIQPGDVRRAIKMQSKRTFRNKIEAMLEGH